MPTFASRSATPSRPSTLVGGTTPARSKDATSYQMRDLLAALNHTPYARPL